MRRHLIVNKSGHFSALPSAQEFAENEYFTSPDRFLVFEVECDAVTMEAIWLKRDNLMVIGPGLPLTHEDQITSPFHMYAKVVMPIEADKAATISLVEVPDGAKLTFAKNLFSLKANQQVEELRKGRFASTALGEERWFSAKDYALFAMGASGQYPVSPSLAGPMELNELTAKQAKAVGKDCALYQQSLSVALVNALSAIDNTTTIEEVAAIDLRVS